MTAASLPDFSNFFRALHGFDPFPWQRVLAERAAAGDWPAQLAIPTGLGKTASIDVAVWSLAHQLAAGGRRTAPTRTYYVVNRRLLVDAAYERANLVAERLRTADDGPVAAVAAALRSAGALGLRGRNGGSDPLYVCRLRGGVDLDARPPDPSQPTVLFATVPMFASRLMFRGYGVSRSMRSVDAALVGIDSLVLLDEAHLARPLLRLMDQLEQCDPGRPAEVLAAPRHRPLLVSLTATGDVIDGALSLDADPDDQDSDQELVRRRVGAHKPTTVELGTRPTVPRRIADAVGDLLADRPRDVACGVFVNTVAHAGAVAEALVSAALDVDVIVLTGRLREPDAAAVRERLLGVGGVSAGRGPDDRHRPLVVVATQTLEVGADLDFDVLVTESAGVRALVQRAGRCNRLGERNDVAEVVIVHGKGDDPVYGDEPGAVVERLSRVDGIDLGPAGVGVLGEPTDEPPRSAELLPVQLWEWAKTTLPPPQEAPLEPFYAGFQDEYARVSVAWRSWLPADGERMTPPVHADEVVDVPIGEARELLDRIDSDRYAVLGRDGEVRGIGHLRPGTTVVLDIRVGGYGPYGWSPDSERTVVDLSIGHLGWVPLRLAQLRRWLGSLDVPTDGDQVREALADVAEGEFAPDAVDVRAVVTALIGQLKAADKPVPSGLGRLGGGTPVVEEAPASREGATDRGLWVARPARGAVATADVRIDAFDDLSQATGLRAHGQGPDPRRLDAHGTAVSEAARHIAARLDLPDEVVADVALAARLHDIGKADARFQRWLDPDGVAETTLAKGDGRRSWRSDQAKAGWPRGGRHELLSLRAVAAAIERDALAANDPALVLHLIASHHGGGRPLVDVVEDPLAARQHFDVLGTGVAVSTDLGCDDWQQPARFRGLCERYGYWGLALLETVLRQADHAASAAQQRVLVVA